MRYFFDMDGVLCKFMHGTPFEAIYEKGYFRNLPPQENILNAAKELIKTNEVYILSSVLSDHPTIKEEKTAWLKEYFSELPANHIIFISCGTNKADIDIFNPDTDVLIDDYGINCQQWTDKSGKYVKVAKNNKDIEKEKERHKTVISPEMITDEIVAMIEKGELDEKNIGNI